MAEKSLMQCNKVGHKNQKYIFLNMSSENKESLFICPICISQQYLEQQKNPQQNQKTLLIDELLNNQLNDGNIFGWPPIQNEKHSKIYYNHQNFIKEIGLENQGLYDSLEKQHKKVEELKQELEKEFGKINESLEPIKNYLPKINYPPPTQLKQQQQQNQQQQQKQTKKYLKLYKSDYDSNRNKGDFEVNNDQQTIKFKSDYGSFIYSENLEREKEYHLRFTMDTKNNVKNISLIFSLTSGNEKNSKDLETDHYVKVFNYYNNNSSAKGGEFKVEGKEKFTEFFKDKQTIMNVVFNIEKKFMEIYDDDKISYQKLSFNQSNKNFQEWILGITYWFGYSRYQEVDIQFID